MPGYHLPLFAAAVSGIWERHRLGVELVEPYPGPANARAAAMGRYDACLTSVAHFLRAKAEEPELEARFVTMVAQDTHMGVFARRQSGIRAFDDLEGASVLGSPDKAFVREYDALLRRLGVERGPLVEVPYEETMAALAAGKADVAADFLDLLPRFEAAGADVVTLPFRDAGIDIYGSGLVAGLGFIHERPEALRRLVRGLRDALEISEDESEPAVAKMRERMPDLDAAYALRGMEAGRPLVTAYEPMTDAKWRRTIDYHADTHGTPRLPPEAVYAEAFEPVSAAV
jgi:NitT/TauT family transport system substrate-binding protein